SGVIGRGDPCIERSTKISSQILSHSTLSVVRAPRMVGKFVYISRWNQLWSTLGVAHADETLFAEIIATYNEPHRKYHTLRHLAECLSHLNQVQHLAARPAEIELTLWFHDAIYDVRRQDNEERSAEWARASAEAASLPREVCDRVQRLVLATR